jgi:hypothetical protein
VFEFGGGFCLSAGVDVVRFFVMTVDRATVFLIDMLVSIPL